MKIQCKKGVNGKYSPLPANYGDLLTAAGTLLSQGSQSRVCRQGGRCFPTVLMVSERNYIKQLEHNEPTSEATFTRAFQSSRGRIFRIKAESNSVSCLIRVRSVYCKGKASVVLEQERTAHWTKLVVMNFIVSMWSCRVGLVVAKICWYVDGWRRGIIFVRAF